jgi:hypothetical protein
VGYRDVPQSITEAIDTFLADEVKALYKKAIDVISKEKGDLWVSKNLGSMPPMRKTDLVPALVEIMRDRECVKMLYNALDEIEQSAVQEAVYDYSGHLDVEMFKAKYGYVPQFVLYSKYSSGNMISLASLFICDTAVAPELKEMLKGFVPSPASAVVKDIESLSANVNIKDREFELVQHRCEESALHDVMAVLQLINSGKVSASPTTGQVTEAGAKAMREVLLYGDYYPEGTEAESEYDVQIGKQGIKPFALCLLMQAGKLAKAEGNKLRLTKAGLTALSQPPHIILKGLWENWLDNKLIHELNRVDIIKGQRSPSNPLYSADAGRYKLADALKGLQAGQWIEINEFFRFLHARGYGFDIARNPWKLYIGDREYGSLGYNNIQWGHINGRFSKAFLLEYAATLGIIDVAIILPWGSNKDADSLWGMHEYSCISRYDGLLYLKLTDLGAWILGRSKDYKPSFHQAARVFNILPNLEITILGHAIPSADRLFLEKIADMKSERTWALSREKILIAIESGMGLEQITDFLMTRNNADAFPHAVDTFFSDIGERITRFCFVEDGKIIECSDAHSALVIANDSAIKKLGILAIDRYIVVPAQKESAFRGVLRKRGYIVRPALRSSIG